VNGTAAVDLSRRELNLRGVISIELDETTRGATPSRQRGGPHLLKDKPLWFCEGRYRHFLTRIPMPAINCEGVDDNVALAALGTLVRFFHDDGARRTERNRGGNYNPVQ
jgi:hypothetical protein